MNFEELSGIWNNNDIELDKSIRINKELIKNVGIKKVRSGLHEIKFTAIIGVVVGIFFSMFLWKFMIANFHDVKFFVPAIILLVTTMFSLVVEIYKLALIFTMDAASPVFQARNKLIAVQKLELLGIYSLYIIIPLFTAPFLIVAAKALLDVNLYAYNLPWLIYLTAGSIVIAAMLIFFLKKFPDKKLSRSISFLNELKENGK